MDKVSDAGFLIIDHIAPVKTINVRGSPKAPWRNCGMVELAKRICRRAERKLQINF